MYLTQRTPTAEEGKESLESRYCDEHLIFLSFLLYQSMSQDWKGSSSTLHLPNDSRGFKLRHSISDMRFELIFRLDRADPARHIFAPQQQFGCRSIIVA